MTWQSRWCRLRGKHKGHIGSTEAGTFWMCDNCGYVLRGEAVELA